MSSASSSQPALSSTTSSLLESPSLLPPSTVRLPTSTVARQSSCAVNRAALNSDKTTPRKGTSSRNIRARAMSRAPSAPPARRSRRGSWSASECRPPGSDGCSTRRRGGLSPGTPSSRAPTSGTTPSPKKSSVGARDWPMLPSSPRLFVSALLVEVQRVPRSSI